LNRKVVVVAITILLISFTLGCIEIENIPTFFDDSYVEIKYEIYKTQESSGFDDVVITVTNHGYDEITISPSDFYFNINQVKTYPSWMINPTLVGENEITLFDGGTTTITFHFSKLSEDVQTTKLEATKESRGEYNTTIIHPQKIKIKGEGALYITKDVSYDDGAIKDAWINITYNDLRDLEWVRFTIFDAFNENRVFYEVNNTENTSHIFLTYHPPLDEVRKGTKFLVKTSYSLSEN